MSKRMGFSLILLIGVVGFSYAAYIGYGICKKIDTANNQAEKAVISWVSTLTSETAELLYTDTNSRHYIVESNSKIYRLNYDSNKEQVNYVIHKDEMIYVRE